VVGKPHNTRVKCEELTAAKEDRFTRCVEISSCCAENFVKAGGGFKKRLTLSLIDSGEDYKEQGRAMQVVKIQRRDLRLCHCCGH
jgi:hypothetical protein